MTKDCLQNNRIVIFTFSANNSRGVFVLTFENIRVGARIKLVGKIKTGNMLVAFSTFLRVAVYFLAGLAVIRFKSFYSSVGGKIMLILCGIAFLLGLLLLQCARTVKDRWFSALNNSGVVFVSDLIAGFSLQDAIKSVKFGVLSFVFSLIRLVVFGALPSALAVLLLLSLREGVSRTVLYVFLFGFAVVAIFSAFFASVSLGCVSLARSLCPGSAGEFMRILKNLEKNSFLLFKFSLFLSTFNRCLRRFSKIVFAGLINGSDYTIL